jgi:hypothetical protein
MFNQPLSFDTSKVTDMNRMFSVRFARALAPTKALSRAFPRACRLRRRRLTPFHLPARNLAPHPMPLPSTRQHAYAFNQPLSFDTSKVTDIGGMFTVRSARALAPTKALSRAFPRACRLRRRRLHALPPPGPQPRPASHAPPFDSAGRARVQPAAEL